MLTDSEREWLNDREIFLAGLGCYIWDGYWDESSPFEDMKEAAEFEGRVTAKLALGCESQTPCNGCWRANWKFCNLRKGYWDCADCFLKAARLAVEEEMNNAKRS